MAAIPIYGRASKLSQDQLLTLDEVMAAGRKEIQATIGRWAIGILAVVFGIGWAISAQVQDLKNASLNGVTKQEFESYKMDQLKTENKRVTFERDQLGVNQAFINVLESMRKEK